MTGQRIIGRCVGCFHPFDLGPCGGCGAVDPCPVLEGAEECPADCRPCASFELDRMCADCVAYAASDM